VCVRVCVCVCVFSVSPASSVQRLLRKYGVATIRRLLKIIGLFCRISSLLWGSFAKETYHFKEHTKRSHPIPTSSSGVTCEEATSVKEAGDAENAHRYARIYMRVFIYEFMGRGRGTPRRYTHMYMDQ